MRALALLLVVNGLLTAADSYAGHPGRWVVAEVSAYYRDDHRTATGGDTRQEAHAYGVAAPDQRDGVPSWNALPAGTLVVVPRGNGYLDGDPDRREPEQRLFPVDDCVPGLAEATKKDGVMHLALRMRSRAAAEAFKPRRVRVFVVDDNAR